MTGKYLFSAPNAPTDNIQWSKGQYRTCAGVCLDVKINGTRKGAKHIQEAPANEEADTKGQWKECSVGVGEDGCVYYVSTADYEPLEKNDNIPNTLKQRGQWLCWKYQIKDNKPTKIPISPATLTPTDATKANWKYSDCIGKSDGVGISLRDGVCCIDFDHCLDDNQNVIYDYITDVISALDTYTEISPSGNGLHLFFLCDAVPDECTRQRSDKGEIYTKNRFMTVTGAIFGVSRDVKEISSEIFKQVYDIIIPLNKVTEKADRKFSEEITTEDSKHIYAWRKSEQFKVAQMTISKLEESKIIGASEQFQSITSRIAIDAAEDAFKQHIPYEAYTSHITPLWEESETYKRCYASREHDYNESKITATIDKAIAAGQAKYDELCTHAREVVSGQESVPEYTADELEEARKIYEYGGMLDYLVKSCQEDHVGDSTIINAMLLSAAAVVVINSGGIHISVTGAAGTGKSHVAKTVRNHLPDKKVIYGGLSDKALLYHPIDDGTVIIMDDEDMTDTLQGIMKQATSSWDKPAEYRTVIDRKPVILQTPARSPWWIIKADKQGDEQVLDRQLVLWVDEGPNQRNAIRRMINQQATNPTSATRNYGIAKALWDCLTPDVVVIPYTAIIDIPRSMDNRNINIFYDLIKAHALMYAPKREHDTEGRLIADRSDFDAICNLINPLFRGDGGSQGLKLSKIEQQVLDYLATKDTGIVPFSDIINGIPISSANLSHAINGRHDDRHYNDGLMKNCPAIMVVSITEDDTEHGQNRRKSLKAVKWSKSTYEKWIAGKSTGFSWIGDRIPADSTQTVLPKHG